MFRVLDDAMIDRHRRNPGTPYSICDGYWWREDGWGVVGFARVVTGREAREGGTPSPREGTPGWVEREAIRGTEERGGQDPLWRLCGSLKRAAFGDGGLSGSRISQGGQCEEPRLRSSSLGLPHVALSA